MIPIHKNTLNRLNIMESDFCFGTDIQEEEIFRSLIGM